MYLLATVLERADNDLLWCVLFISLAPLCVHRHQPASLADLTCRRFAILGLTYQYTTSRISRTEYEKFHSVYHDEVARLNPAPSASLTNDQDFKALGPDDRSIYAAEELRFMMFRHWNLYDAMYHSSYVAGKLGIWKEKGRKRLTGLLAKMGYASRSYASLSHRSYRT